MYTLALCADKNVLVYMYDHIHGETFGQCKTEKNISLPKTGLHTIDVDMQHTILSWIHPIT